MNVEQWLRNAKLTQCRSLFIQEQITIEELLACTDAELQAVCQQTFRLNVLHTKRFIKAIRSTKKQYSDLSVDRKSVSEHATENTIRQVKIIRTHLSNYEAKQNRNSIQNGIKVLNDNCNRIQFQMDQYFADTQTRLRWKHQQLSTSLNQIKMQKANALQAKTSQITEMDSLIEIQFETELRDLFTDDICVIKKCIVPDTPVIKVKSKARQSESMTLAITVMPTQKKKAIVLNPFSNDTKNDRILEIEVEYVQIKITHSYSVSDPFIASRKNGHIRKSKRIIIDKHQKTFKIVYQIALRELLPECYCYVRVRTKNISGWSEYAHANNVMDKADSTRSLNSPPPFNLRNFTESYKDNGTSNDITSPVPSAKSDYSNKTPSPNGCRFVWTPGKTTHSVGSIMTKAHPMPVSQRLYDIDNSMMITNGTQSQTEKDNMSSVLDKMSANFNNMAHTRNHLQLHNSLLNVSMPRNDSTASSFSACPPSIAAQSPKKVKKQTRKNIRYNINNKGVSVPMSKPKTKKRKSRVRFSKHTQYNGNTSLGPSVNDSVNCKEIKLVENNDKQKIKTSKSLGSLSKKSKGNKTKNGINPKINVIKRRSFAQKDTKTLNMTRSPSLSKESSRESTVPPLFVPKDSEQDLAFQRNVSRDDSNINILGKGLSEKVPITYHNCTISRNTVTNISY